MKINVTETDTRVGRIALITITGDSGCIVGLSNLGAGITSVVVPDRNRELDDIVLGYGDPADYMADGPCAGKTPGRFANRIANGHFSIGDNRYSLTINNGPNALHGGPTGFMNRLWQWRLTSHGVCFSRLSPDGEEGYPGNLHVEVEYSWDDVNTTLSITYRATTDATTIVNLTNHAYFNLSGHDSGSCLDQYLQLMCRRWLPVDNTDIPLSDNLEPVEGSPMDFLSAKPIGADIRTDFSTLRTGKGYNHYFMLDDSKNNDSLRRLATITDPRSHRGLDISTTYPGAMLYTGNWLDGSPLCKPSGGKLPRPYRDYDGVAIECQFPPDAPNQPHLPQATLYPGQLYHHTIVYRFYVAD